MCCPCPPERHLGASEVIIHRWYSTLPSCQKWAQTWTLPELPLVTGILGLIQAAPPKTGFLFWVGKKKSFLWIPESGKPFLLSNSIRAFVTELLPPLILQQAKSPEWVFLEHLKTWKTFIGNNGVFCLCIVFVLPKSCLTFSQQQP